MSKNQDTIPGWPNHFPYNDLLLDGKLFAKSRSRRWNHRGTVLLYTSTRVAKEVAFSHHIDPKTSPKGHIVGVGNLVDVRELTAEEGVKLTCQFCNVPVTDEDIKEFLKRYSHFDWESALYFLSGYFHRDFHTYVSTFGYFFEDLTRFPEPIPFKPPRGAVSVFKVPIELVADALKEIDFDLG